MDEKLWQLHRRDRDLGGEVLRRPADDRTGAGLVARLRPGRADRGRNSPRRSRPARDRSAARPSSLVRIRFVDRLHIRGERADRFRHPARGLGRPGPGPGRRAGPRADRPGAGRARRRAAQPARAAAGARCVLRLVGVAHARAGGRVAGVQANRDGETRDDGADAAVRGRGPGPALRQASWPSTGSTWRSKPARCSGLLGPNGAGKTTLVRILATLLDAERGASRASSATTWPTEPLAVRRRIGLAGQFAAVDGELTGRENLEMVGRLYRLPGREARAARRRGARAFWADRRRRPAGGDVLRRHAPPARSRPRASSAAHRSLLLDEPTTGLDPRSRQELWAIVDELRREGTTVLLTTQYLEEADRLAQRIAVRRPRPDRRAGNGRRAQGARSAAEMLMLRITEPTQATTAGGLLADLCHPRPAGGRHDRPGRSASPSPTRAPRPKRDAAARRPRPARSPPSSSSSPPSTTCSSP